MTRKFQPNDRVAITLGDDGVAQLRMIRTDKINALDDAMFTTLLEAGEALFEMKGLRAVVMSGEGRGFCAGIDTSLFSVLAAPDAPRLASRTHGNANRYQQVAMQWRKLPLPVIAAIHGVCFGGGLQLASGADIRIIAPDTRLSIMEMKWGLVPDMGGFALWRGQIRNDALRDLIFTNREFTGEEALHLGLATHVDPSPVGRATAIAQDIASRSPHAMRAAKALLNRMADASQMEGRAPDFVDP
jgi:enoyl-CoA hydratase/carnithine racemase